MSGDPGLGPLAGNGGPTQSMALSLTSPGANVPCATASDALTQVSPVPTPVTVKVSGTITDRLVIPLRPGAASVLARRTFGQTARRVQAMAAPRSLSRQRRRWSR